MKKLLSMCIFTMLFVFTFLLNSCAIRKCAYCDSTNVQYEAFFIPSGTFEYYCEDCYNKREEGIDNSPYPIAGEDLWIIKNI